MPAALSSSAAQDPPDDAVKEGRLDMRGPLDLDSLPETRHVDVQVLNDTAVADVQRGAVGAVVDTCLPQRSLPSDEHPLAHMHRLPAHVCAHRYTLLVLQSHN